MATFDVTSTADSGAGSLRQAIVDANGSTGADTIAFDPTLRGQTIQLTTGFLAISDDLSVEGLGQANLTINGGGNDIFRMDTVGVSVLIRDLTVAQGSDNIEVNGSNVSLTLRGVTSANALTDDGLSIDGTGSTITVHDSRFIGSEDNFAVEGNDNTVLIDRSTILDGTEDGLEVDGSGNTITVRSSTIAGNGFIAGDPNDGIDIDGGGNTLTLQQITLSGNAEDGLDVEGAGNSVTLSLSTVAGNGRGGVFNQDRLTRPGRQDLPLSTIDVTGSVIARQPHDVLSDQPAGVTSSGYNLSGNGTWAPTRDPTLPDGMDITGIGSTGSVGFEGPGDLLGTPAAPLDPRLGPLQNNGGPTPTQLLLSGSPAIDAGNPAFVPPPDADQRGDMFPRVRNGRIDLGATEFGTRGLLVGTEGDDFFDLTGTSGFEVQMLGGDDTVRASSFPDHFDGGAGFDTVDHSNASSGVALALVRIDEHGIGGAYAGAGPGGLAGDAEGDSYLGIEHIVGTNFRDLVYGGDEGTVASLGGGDDVFDNRDPVQAQDRVSGGDGNDRVWTGAGNDYGSGENGDDHLFGEDGNDVLEGGAGADSQDGGAGGDRVTYSGSSSRVVVLLENTDASGVGNVYVDAPAGGREGDAEADSYVSIENVTGSSFDDLVFGLSTGTDANLAGGDDVFDNDQRSEARDVIFGGAGNDRIWTGGGSDSLLGDDGADHLHGEEGDDELLGDAGSDELFGGSGFDRLNGGADNDTLRGGEDGTAFDSDRFVVSAGRDLIVDFEVGWDKIDTGVSPELAFELLDTDRNTVLGDADANVDLEASGLVLRFTGISVISGDVFSELVVAGVNSLDIGAFG